MNENNFSSGQLAVNRGKQLDAVRIQLLSSLPSDVWRGMLQVRKWLQESPEDQDTYALLLDAVQGNPSLRQEIRNLLEEMSQKGSRTASDALRILPASVQDVITDADDAYYAADYEQAIQLYRQVLILDPNNVRARDQLAKSELNRIAGMPDIGLPRAAVQFFRRARSHYAARDVSTAMNLLNAALDAAQAKGMDFPEAKNLLNSMQDLLTADEYKARAELSLKKEQWGDALDLYNKTLLLDPQNEAIKKIIDGLQGLLRADVLLDSLADPHADASDRLDKIDKVNTFRKTAEENQDLVNTSLLRRVQVKYNIYKSEADLQMWGMLKGLAPQGRLSKAIGVAREVLKLEDPSIKYASERIKYFNLMKIVTIATSFVVIFIIVGVVTQLFDRDPGPPQPPGNTAILTNTVTLTILVPATATGTPTATKTLTIIPVVTLLPTVTFTPVFTVTETVTPSLTVTETATPYKMGITTKFLHPASEPDGTWVGGALNVKHVVAILDEQKGNNGVIWYFCQWELNGEIQHGWILADFIQIGSYPTPAVFATTPTP